MTRPAAIEADFAAFKIIQGRKVAQLIIEVPIEAADNALAVLGGVPRPDESRPVAVARLRKPAESEAQSDVAIAALQDENYSCDGEDIRAPAQPVTEPEPIRTIPAHPDQCGPNYPEEYERSRPDPDAIAQAAADRKPMTPSQRCAMLCNDIRFQTFLRDRWPEVVRSAAEDAGPGITVDDLAGEVVRRLCDVGSRREFDEPGQPAERWRAIHAEFDREAV